MSVLQENNCGWYLQALQALLVAGAEQTQTTLFPHLTLGIVVGDADGDAKTTGA